jgi:hypothetical protein
MTQPLDGVALSSVLKPVSAALAADGYELSAALESGALRVAIAAGPDACEDCLVPKSMMLSMIKSVLHDAGVELAQVELTYPNES